MANRTRSVALVLAGVVLGLDQWSKAWALSHLEEPGRGLVLPGPVDLTLSLNQSNAFGLTPVVGDLTRWGLTVLNFAVAATIFVMIVRSTLHPLMNFGLALVMAGAVGNAIDRFRLGAVVDFIDASKIGFIWIFNLSDAAVDAGIALIALGALLSRPVKNV